MEQLVTPIPLTRAEGHRRGIPYEFFAKAPVLKREQINDPTFPTGDGVSVNTLKIASSAVPS